MRLKRFFLLIAFFFSSLTHSEELLSLQDAVTTALQNNYAIKALNYNQQELVVNRLLSEDSNSSKLNLKSNLQWVKPSALYTFSQDISGSVSLVYSKNLYDFGRTTSKLKEFDQQKISIKLSNKLLKQKQVLKVITDFFNVLISDLNFNVWNEGMSIAFVRQDRAVDRLQLKEITELDLLALQRTFQSALIKRTEAENKQRLMRSQLSKSMGSNNLPSNLDDMAKVLWEKEIPEYDDLVIGAIKHNGEIKLLLSNIKAKQQQRKTIAKQTSPNLTLEADINAYSLETPFSHPATVTLQFDYPLYSGSVPSLKRQQIDIVLERLKNNLYAKQQQIKHQLLSVWQQLNLLSVKKQHSDVNSDYQDYYLDRSRALYELEMQNDLGNAMTEFSAAILEKATIKYQWVLAWEELSIITNQPKYSILGLRYE